MRKTKLEFSKKLLVQESVLIWIVTLATLALAFICVLRGYLGTLPWLTALVGLPWGAYGTSQAFYYNKSKCENTIGGVTYEKVMANMKANGTINTDYGI